MSRIPTKHIQFPIGKFFTYSPYLILSIFFALPLIGLFHYDFWDGSRIALAQSTNDFSGVRLWFFSASVEGQYFQEYFFNLIADFLKIPELTISHILVVTSVAVIIREVTIIAKDFLMVRKELLPIPGLIVAIFPSLSLNVSSVLTYYMTSISIGWYCARKFATSIGKVRLLAFLGIIYTFQYGVMNLVCPTLVLFFTIVRSNNVKSEFFKKFKLVIIIFAVAIGFKIFMLIYNQPSGEYLNYNKISVPTELAGISELIYGIKSFSSFFLYSILLILPTFIWGFFLRDSQFKPLKKIGEERYKRASILAVLFSTIVPYLLVGKSTSLFWLDYWTGRHSFALIPSLALFSVLVLDWLLKLLEPISVRQIQIIITFSSLVIIFMSAFLFVRVLGVKYLEQQNRISLVKTLASVREEILPGTVNVSITNSEFLNLNSDEANYLMYKVKGNLYSYTTVESNNNESQFAYDSNTKFFPGKTFIPGKYKKTCRTDIQIIRVNLLSKFPRLETNPKYKIKSLKSECLE